MEQFKQNPIRLEKIGTIERQEGIDFVATVKKDIVDTFPFLSEDERDAFAKKLDSLLGNDEIISEPEVLEKQIRLAIATLDNSHTELEDQKKQYGLDKLIYHRAGTFWVDTGNGTLEVVSFNGTPLISLVEEKRKEVGGGTDEWKIGEALRIIMTSKNESSAVIETRDNAGKLSKIGTKFSDKKSGKKKFVDGEMVSDKIGYLNIRSWSNQIKIDGKNIAELVEEELKNLKDSDSLIIDVRQNGGGNSRLAEKLAGHFIDKPAQYCKVLRKAPDQERLVEKSCYVDPEGEFLDKEVAILTGPRCLSSNELFVMMLKDTGKAVTIGRTTGGGSGNPKSFDLRLGDRDFTLTVSTWRMLRNDGRALEGIGIEPDVPVEMTPDDVVKHRDVELEKAIEFLESRGRSSDPSASEKPG